ncbi:hypothetical protein B0T25DRAFT_86179 [Lasiosphaeria hispida]|uniref:Uncharacterized protein n=1 Tax=Lasiosphaeria hispida TaxID=260671 RepID=A0AAJ0MHF6_9PEZI|nr:hypothetical protein B0T25DRAFT_86179 [Lasiosphaeria hispida]
MQKPAVRSQILGFVSASAHTSPQKCPSTPRDAGSSRLTLLDGMSKIPHSTSRRLTMYPTWMLVAPAAGPQNSRSTFQTMFSRGDLAHNGSRHERRAHFRLVSRAPSAATVSNPITAKSLQQTFPAHRNDFLQHILNGCPLKGCATQTATKSTCFREPRSNLHALAPISAKRQVEFLARRGSLSPAFVCPSTWRFRHVPIRSLGLIDIPGEGIRQPHVLHLA